MLTGNIGTYDCPIALNLFGPSDPVRKDQVRTQMRADRLPLTELIRTEQDKARKEWQRQRALKEAEKKIGTGTYPTLQRPKQAMESTSLEDLVQQSSSINAHRVNQAVERFGNTEVDLENMPMVETPFSRPHLRETLVNPSASPPSRAGLSPPSAVRSPAVASNP